jgi:putative ABC transport system permease protein
VTDPVGVWEAAASLTLVALAIALSRWQRMGIERSIAWAALRAAVQLLAVGAVLAVIFRSSHSWLWSVAWVAGMVIVAAFTVRRRAPAIPGLGWVGFGSIAASTGVSLALLLIPDVLPAEPVTFVVVAGITIGNTMPSTVLAVDLVTRYARDHRLDLEGLLSLGFDARGTTRFLVTETARIALIPQIERTKVVGLIALPGAMTGLLLAGVDAFDAVVVQLVIMYLVLGSVATSVAIVTLAASRKVLTPDLRLAPWTANPAGSGSQPRRLLGHSRHRITEPRPR